MCTAREGERKISQWGMMVPVEDKKTKLDAMKAIDGGLEVGLDPGG
jgi:hypothetical protein